MKTAHRPSKPVPTFLVVIVVVVTAGVTGFAMMKAGYADAWAANQPYTLAAAPQFWTPWAAVADKPILDVVPVGGVTPNGTPAAGVAAPGTPPTIRSGSRAAHPDRGVCTGCHAVVDARGAAIPAIQTFSALTHGFRGVCANCHKMATGQLVAAPTPQPAAAKAPAKPATEGEWLGMELSPLDQLTATQYSIPIGTPGLVLAEAEAQAAAVGLKPGDVLVGVNGAPVRNMDDFFRATRNGTLPEGIIDILRKDQQLRIRLHQGAVAAAAAKQPPAPAAAPVAPPPVTPAPMAPPPYPMNPMQPKPQPNGAPGWSTPF